MSKSTVTHFNGPIRISGATSRTIIDILFNQNPFFGIPSGYEIIDKYTHGWQPGEVIIIGGQCAVGKSALALNLLLNAAMGKTTPVAYFALSMSEGEVVRRLIQIESGISSGELYSTESIKQGLWQQINACIERLDKLPIYIDETCNLSMNEFEARVQSLTNDDGVKLIIVDYLSLMARDGAKSTAEGNDENLFALKEVAQKYKVPIIAICYAHAGNTNDTYRASVGDLRKDFPSIQHYADKIFLINRPSWHSGKTFSETQDIIEVVLAVNKQGFSVVIDLLIDKGSGKITEMRVSKDI